MKIRNSKLRKLLAKYKEIALLGKVNAVLSWDLQVNTPFSGSLARAKQEALIAGLIADRWQDDEFKALLGDLSDEKSKLGLEEKSIVRNLERSAKYYTRVPKEIIVKQAELTSKSFMVWQEARSKNDFKTFAPILTQVIELEKEIANYIGYKKDPYDTFLDMYEPNLTAKDCSKIFAKLTPELIKILASIKKSKIYNDNTTDQLLKQNYSLDDQRKICVFVLKRMGYDFDSGRMDTSAHPFTISFDNHDVRITNRYKQNDFRDALMGAMHEGGHALYEQGVKDKYTNTPLEGGISLGIHESQSRFWENQIGRSEEFFEFLTPVLHAYYPNEVGKFRAIDFYRFFNMVSPSFIRVDADEVTYNLHIALRFELEHALFNNNLKVKDLAGAWREKMRKYFGITPKNDSDGVLQDVHWSYGSFGYFPTYTLGNLYSSQFANKMAKRINIASLVRKGDFSMILSWFRTNIHEHGSLYLPDELSKRVTGETLNPKYFIRYIKEKYSRLYEVKL